MTLEEQIIKDMGDTQIEDLLIKTNKEIIELNKTKSLLIQEQNTRKHGFRVGDKVLFDGKRAEVAEVSWYWVSVRLVTKKGELSKNITHDYNNNKVRLDPDG